VHSGTTKDSSRSRALLSALVAGLTYDFYSNHIRIFLPDCLLSSTVFRLSKHTDLSLSCAVTDHFSSFVSANELHCIDLFRHSIKWSGLPGKAVMDDFTEREQQAIFPLAPTPLLAPKECLLHDLQVEYLATNRSARVWQSIILPDGRPPPFYIGALSRKDRGTSSSAVQLACDHAFTSTYSGAFRTNAGDNTLCPCNFDQTPTSRHSSLDHLPNFDQLMAEFLSTSPRTHLPRQQHQRPRPRLFPNSTAHVLFQCPLHSSPHRCIFGIHANEAYIFGTEDGGRKLGEFQRATNRLLCPLPPRPDPP